jgi:hypothetical protein
LLYAEVAVEIMRGNLPVPSARRREQDGTHGSHRNRCAAAALFPAVEILAEILPATIGDQKNKAAAGLNPAPPATLVDE